MTSSTLGPSDRRSGRLGIAKIAVLTATPDEFSEAEKFFKIQGAILGTSYHPCNKISSDPNIYDIVLTQLIDRSNAPAGEAVAHLVEQHAPAFFILVGTAGGISGRENVNLGDIVVADYVEYGGFVKFAGGKGTPRKIPYDHPSLYLRNHLARPLRKRTEWQTKICVKRPDGTTDQPKLIEGSIISTDSIWGDPQHVEAQRMMLRQNVPDLRALWKHGTTSERP